MYEARQNKEKVSRRIDGGGKKYAINMENIASVPLISIMRKDNKMAILNKSVIQTKLDESTMNMVMNNILIFAASSPLILDKEKIEKQISTILKNKNIEIENDDIEKVFNAYQIYISTYKFDFDSFIKGIPISGNENEVANQYKKVLSKTTDKPQIIYGTGCFSLGYYDPHKKVIVVDFKKNATGVDKLDTILFELQNHKHRQTFIDANLPSNRSRGAEMIADVEYESNKKYIQELFEIYKVKNLDSLVHAMGINNAFLIDAKIPSDPIDIPDEIQSQSHRTVLWFWKTRNWNENDIKSKWKNSDHVPGSGSTIEIYSQK